MVTSPQRSEGLLLLLPWDLHHLGGVNQVVVNLYNQAQKSGRWHPIVFINKWESQEPTLRDVDGRPTISFRLRSLWLKEKPWRWLIAVLLQLPATLTTLHKMLALNGVSVVNVHYPGLSALYFVILRWLGKYNGKLLLSFHGLDIDHAQKATGIEKRLWRILIRSADSIVTCSHALKLRVADFVPNREHAITVIHNGLDTAFFEDESDKSFVLDTLFAERKYILTIGTFEHKKGQDLLVKAFHQIAHDFPDVALVLVGRGGPALTELKAMARNHESHARIFFYEDMPHSTIATFLQHASVFCLPSRAEPFGIVLLEAGLFGLPVVAFRVGGIPEIIVDGVHGYLVPPDDIVALAEKLRNSLLDRNTATRYGSELRNRVVNHFTWKCAFGQYEALIKGGDA